MHIVDKKPDGVTVRKLAEQYNVGGAIVVHENPRMLKKNVTYGPVYIVTISEIDKHVCAGMNDQRFKNMCRIRGMEEARHGSILKSTRAAIQLEPHEREYRNVSPEIVLARRLTLLRFMKRNCREMESRNRCHLL